MPRSLSQWSGFVLTRQPVAGTPEGFATSSAWWISQLSPSSVGVESVSSETPGNLVSPGKRRIGPVLRPVGTNEDHGAARDSPVTPLEAADVRHLWGRS